MPCNCDHLEPTLREKESVRVLGFLKEVGFGEYKKFDKYYGNLATLDKDTAKLCEWCKENPEQVKKQSLELQIWWRDHQAADKKKEEARQLKAKLKELQKKALKKLTPEEREALGLKV